jgi:hypothetical protein
MLGTVDPKRQFQVSVFAPSRFILSGAKRREYWLDFDASTLEYAVVFFDPDNGYETKTQYEKKKVPARKYIGHDELRNLFARLPNTSVAVVFQYRPFRRWADLFEDLKLNLAYAHSAVAVHESNLAFVAMAGNATTGKQIGDAMEEYVNRNPPVKFTLICGAGKMQGRV